MPTTQPDEMRGLNKTRQVISDIYNAKAEWEDGLMTDSSMVELVDKLMVDYLADKGIVLSTSIT